VVGQDVGRAQHHLDHVAVGHEAAGAHVIEGGLEHVGETHQRLEAERACAALDRMDGPEHGVDRLGIAIAILHGEKARLEFPELLFTFLEEGNFDGCQAVQVRVLAGVSRAVSRQAATRRMASASFVGLKGFTIQPVAPACLARFFFSASLSVVSTRIGVAR
jgi:hypothetical protein